MPDFGIAFIDGQLDVVFDEETDDIYADAGIRTAVLLSLYTDAPADADDEIPARDGDRRGWWADELKTDPTDVTGSKLWLLARAKVTETLEADVVDYVQTALQWMIDDDVAKSVDVTTEVTQVDGVKRLAYTVAITKPDDSQLDYRFAHVWDQERASFVLVI